MLVRPCIGTDSEMLAAGTLLSPRQLEAFRDARSKLRNPFAQLFRLCLSGLDRQKLVLACTADGPQLPETAGEFGKGLDLVGALRPCCVKPWAFPPGKHTLLICDVAVGIPWRLPEGAQVYGEWDEEAAGTLKQRLTQWAISHTGCELCSPQGWLRVATGGRAEAAERVDKDQVLSFSFRVCSVYSPQVEVREERVASQGLRGCCGIQRGQCDSPSYARFLTASSQNAHHIAFHLV